MTPEELVVEIEKAVKEKNLALERNLWGVCWKDGIWESVFVGGKSCCALSSLIIKEESNITDAIRAIMVKTGLAYTQIIDFAAGFDMSENLHAKLNNRTSFFIAGFRYGQKYFAEKK